MKFHEKSIYFKAKVFKGFFDGLIEVEAHENGAVEYVPEHKIKPIIDNLLEQVRKMKTSLQYCTYPKNWIGQWDPIQIATEALAEQEHLQRKLEKL